MNQWREYVRVIVVRHTLERSSNPFESRTRIDGRLGQRHERTVRLTVVLHEDEIPDLEESPRLSAFDEGLERILIVLLCPLAACARRVAPVVGEVRKVDIDLRTGTTRSGVGHLPEVVFVTQTVDPAVRQAGDLAP